MGFAQMLGLKPRPEGRIGQDAAQEAALQHLRALGTHMRPESCSGTLTWDASGRAVWRLTWPGPVPDGPALVVDVEARDGTVVRAGLPPR